jgi:hypothetical protein
MRKFLLVVLLFPIVLHAQDLNKINKIIFNYNIGGYNFGDTGYYAKEETVEFTRTKGKTFSRHTVDVIKRYVYNPATEQNNLSINDTVLNKRNSKFSLTDFQILIDQLNVTKDNFDVHNIKTRLPALDKKEILSIAKRYNKDFWFIDDETKKTDEFGREKIEKIKSYNFLDSFLKAEKPDPRFEWAIIDAWNSFTIRFVEQRDTIKYTFQLYSLLGQPFSRIVNRDFSKRTLSINSEVNGELIKFLLRNSIARKAIGYNQLQEKYILWFINNQMWDHQIKSPSDSSK